MQHQDVFARGSRVTVCRLEKVTPLWPLRCQIHSRTQSAEFKAESHFGKCRKSLIEVEEEEAGGGEVTLVAEGKNK